MFRFIRFAVLALAVAAVVVPAGQAMTFITDNAPGQGGDGAGRAAVYVHSPGLAQSEPASAPDAIARYMHTLGEPSAAPVAFTSENAPSQNRISLLNAAETGALSSGSNSFDWGDAGIGAGSVGGFLLLVCAGMLVASRRNQSGRLAL